MGNLTLKNITKNYNNINILSDINIDLENGNFLVLVGPSGCGKTTLLNVIAGLETSDTGKIFIENQDVTAQSPAERNIAMVFQSYALYPSMTVKKNISFGLEMRKKPRDFIEKKVKEVANTLQISHLLDRKPAQLSGGQRQRVAMGRAIVRDPSIFLFDEPLSNLDAKLRVEMRSEIKKLHQRLKTTIVYVTHDQIEALTLADRIAIMSGGIIQQYDSPDQIYNNPINTFTAEFIGSNSMNMLTTTLKKQGNDYYLSLADKSDNIAISLSSYSYSSKLESYLDKKLLLGFRPEDFNLALDDNQKKQSFNRQVTYCETAGLDSYIEVNVGDTVVRGRIPTKYIVQITKKYDFYIDIMRLHLFDIETKRNINR